ncbi:MAG: phospholipase [Acidobacteria bacterium]|nr:phospholipase [Acidobacteriota bacterium]
MLKDLYGKSRKFRMLFILLLWIAGIPVLQAGTPAAVTVVTTIPVETTLNRKITPSAAKIWVNMIDSARKTLDFGEFYLTGGNKPPLKQVVNAVLQAKKRGVRVRILTDRKMEKNSTALIARFRKAGIAVEIFDWGKLTGGVLHAKYFVVDGKMAYVGSQNFDWRSLKHIHETGVKVTDPAVVKGISEIFNSDWAFSAGNVNVYREMRKLKPLKFSPGCRLVASPGKFNPPGVNAALPELLNLIGKAKKKITIQLLNYSTWRYHSKKRFFDIDAALRAAAKRGVRVRMMVSDWNKRKPAVRDVQSLAAVPGITVKFVTIPPSKTGFIPYARVIHSKVMRVDDTVCWIGTSNWAYDYFYSSRNLELVIRNRKIANTLDMLFSNLWNSAYAVKVKPKADYKPPRIH